MADKPPPPPYSEFGNAGQPYGGPSSPPPQPQPGYTTTVSGPRIRGPDKEYLKSVCGIAKIVQAVVCLIGFIIGLSVYFSGVGFVNFATINGFIEAVIWFILHLLHAIPQVLANYYIEMILYCIIGLFLFIGAIVAAAFGYVGGAVGALSFFCFVATAAYGVDIALQFIDIRRKFSERRGTAGQVPVDPQFA